MTKSTKALLLLILFLTSPIYSMHQLTLPNLVLNDRIKQGFPFLSCSAFIGGIIGGLIALGLLYLKHEWIENLIKNIPPTTIKSSTVNTSTNNKLWIETNDNITSLIEIKKDIPESILQYYLEEYTQRFGHYNNADTPLKIGYSFYDLTLLKTASNRLNSNMTQFSFNHQQQAILLEMASIFKMRKLYLALLNNMIPPHINNQYISYYWMALEQKTTTTLFNEVMKLTPPTTYIVWPIDEIKHTHDHKYIVQYVKPSYKHSDILLIRDTRTSVNNNVFKNDDGPWSDCLVDYSDFFKGNYKTFPLFYNYCIFSRKNLILFTPPHYDFVENPFDPFGDLFAPFIYDIEKDVKYDLEIKIKSVRSAAVSPDENYVAICLKDGNIYIFNIRNLNNIKQYPPLSHPNVLGVTFSPNSKMIASGGGDVRLWNISDLDKDNCLPRLYNFADISKIKRSQDKIEDRLICFNQDNEHIFTTLVNPYISVIFNINDQTKHIINEGCCSNFNIFPKNSDLIAYVIFPKNSDRRILKIINIKGTKLFSEEDYGDITISDNEKNIAINKWSVFDLITINKDSTTYKKLAENINGKCTAINDDGSFWTKTFKTINFYSSTKKLLTTVNNSAYSYDDPTRPIIFYNDIKSLVTDITPLRYHLITHACNTPRKENSLLSIEKNSLEDHTLQSFGIHKELLANILQLQITP
jgi:hypothetical protein